MSKRRTIAQTRRTLEKVFNSYDKLRHMAHAFDVSEVTLRKWRDAGCLNSCSGERLLKIWKSFLQKMNKVGKSGPKMAEKCESRIMSTSFIGPRGSNEPLPSDKSKIPYVEFRLKGKRGGIALIDRADWALVRKYPSWHLHNLGYATTTTYQNERKVTLLLHRLILGITDRKITVDHISRDKLDCRRANLRTGPQSLNCQNQGLSKNNTSGFRGVTLNKKSGLWLASAILNGKSHRIGYFDTAEAAGAAAAAWRAEHMPFSAEARLL